jgi:hypothetical protein
MPDAHVAVGIDDVLGGQDTVCRGEILDDGWIHRATGRWRRLCRRGACVTPGGNDKSQSCDCNDTGTPNHIFSSVVSELPPEILAPK